MYFKAEESLYLLIASDLINRGFGAESRRSDKFLRLPGHYDWLFGGYSELSLHCGESAHQRTANRLPNLTELTRNRAGELAGRRIDWDSSSYPAAGPVPVLW